MSRMTLAENIATRRTFWPLVELTPQSRASGGYLSFIYHENSISYQDTVPGVCMAYPVHLPTQCVTHWTLLCTWTSRHEQKLLCVSASEILFFGSFLSDGPPRASGVVWTWVNTTVKSRRRLWRIWTSCFASPALPLCHPSLELRVVSEDLEPKERVTVTTQLRGPPWEYLFRICFVLGRVFMWCTIRRHRWTTCSVWHIDSCMVDQRDGSRLFFSSSILEKRSTSTPPPVYLPGTEAPV